MEVEQLSRTDRQKLCVKRWLENKGNGIIEAVPGFGKSRTSLMIIKLLLKNKPNAKILISVPTDIIKEQWIKELIKHNLFYSCTVEIVNTIVKNEWWVDLLIIDEIHLVVSDVYVNIFDQVKYDLFLGLTGTLTRLDGKEKLLFKYTKVIDTIGLTEALNNNWLSEYREYKVLIDVDLQEYNEYNLKFNSYFAFFDFNFELAMSCVKNIVSRRYYARNMGYTEKEVTAMAMDWMRCLHKRKSFVMSHPKKLEITHKILEQRLNKKCITFSATIKDCEKIKYGYTLHSGKTKKARGIILSEFNELPIGILNTNKAADLGLDIPDLNVAIILSGNSSKSNKNQRIGRIIRRQEGKIAEVFSLIIKGTVDEMWFNNASEGKSYMTINERQLELVLKGENIETRQRNDTTNIEYRF